MLDSGCSTIHPQRNSIKAKFFSPFDIYAHSCYTEKNYERQAAEMKKLKKLFALIIVVSMLCSLALVFSLSAYPQHSHLCPERGCAVCTVVNFAQMLFKAMSLSAVFSVLIAIFCARRFVPLRRILTVKTQTETLVTLKTKISA